MKAAHFQIALLLLCYWKGITVARQTTGRTTNNCSKKVYQIFETAHCLLCPLNALLVRCPNGTRQLTTGMGLKKCVLSFNLYGCVHLCSKEIVQSVCCENHWGPDCRRKFDRNYATIISVVIKSFNVYIFSRMVL